MLGFNTFSFVNAGGEEARAAGQTMESSRRRLSGQIINAGSSSKQKSLVANESPITKDAMVSCLDLFFLFLPQIVQSFLLSYNAWSSFKYGLMHVEY